MWHEVVYGLHRSGLYRMIDECRDYAEFLQSNQRNSFSQYGEDLFLQEYFMNRKGYYMDIGGNHPIRGSNTYQLYRKGWEGIVVEPIKRFYEKHRRRRPRDVQINAAVGAASGRLTFYEMIPSVLSTCDLDEVEGVLSRRSGKLLRTSTVQVFTATDLYRKYMAPRPIDLLCVDTEGHDLAVLQGVDWSSVCPEIVVCEANEIDAEIKIRQFLAGCGYSCLKVLGGSLIFGECSGKR